MLKGFTVPKSPFGQAALITAAALALFRRCCGRRVLDRPRRGGSDIAERPFP